MRGNSLWLFSFKRLPLALFTGMTLLLASPLAGVAAESAIDPYDASKFESLPVPGAFPHYTVKDQRASKQIFFKMKRKMMPPAEYLADGIKSTVENSGSVAPQETFELQFLINDFRVELERKTSVAARDTGEISSRMEVDVIAVEGGSQAKIGNYSAIAFREIEHLSSGVATADIQSVLDQNLYGLLKKIFNDQSFIDIVSKAP